MSYEELVRKFHELESDDPISLVANEDFSKADELPDNSREAVEKDAAKELALADEIKEAGYPGKDFDERLDMELAENNLRGSALYALAPIDGTPGYAVHPIALYVLLQWTPEYLERDPREKSKIVDSFISRMNNPMAKKINISPT